MADTNILDDTKRLFFDDISKSKQFSEMVGAEVDNYISKQKSLSTTNSYNAEKFDAENDDKIIMQYYSFKPKLQYITTNDSFDIWRDKFNSVIAKVRNIQEFPEINYRNNSDSILSTYTDDNGNTTLIWKHFLDYLTDYNVMFAPEPEHDIRFNNAIGLYDVRELDDHDDTTDIDAVQSISSYNAYMSYTGDAFLTKEISLVNDIGSVYYNTTGTSSEVSKKILEYASDNEKVFKNFIAYEKLNSNLVTNAELISYKTYNAYKKASGTNNNVELEFTNFVKNDRFTFAEFVEYTKETDNSLYKKALLGDFPDYTFDNYVIDIDKTLYKIIKSTDNTPEKIDTAYLKYMLSNDEVDVNRAVTISNDLTGTDGKMKKSVGVVAVRGNTYQRNINLVSDGSTEDITYFDNASSHTEKFETTNLNFYSSHTKKGISDVALSMKMGYNGSTNLLQYDLNDVQLSFNYTDTASLGKKLVLDNGYAPKATLGTTPAVFLTITDTETTKNCNTLSLGSNTSELNLNVYGDIIGVSNTVGNPELTPKIHGFRVYTAMYNDYAEYFETVDDTEVGDIISLDCSAEEELYHKAEQGDTCIVGVHSDTYGHILGGGNPDKKYIPVGLVGRVFTKIIGSVKKGDKIVLSEIPGVGRVKSSPEQETIGYALEASTDEKIKKIRIKLTV